MTRDAILNAVLLSRASFCDVCWWLTTVLRVWLTVIWHIFMNKFFKSCLFDNRFHYCRILLHVLGKPCGEIRGESR